MSLETTVSRYYEAVDAGDIEGLLELFADDAHYDRPGYPLIFGRAGLRTFYSSQRIISQGRHQILTMVRDSCCVAVRGAFSGTSKAGKVLDLQFADFFRGGSLISHRQTYFFAPLV